MEIGEKEELDVRGETKFRLTSANISEEDWQFCKLRHLKFSVLLQERIAQIRAVESGAIVSNVEQERVKREKFQTHFQNAIDFLQEKNLINEYWERYK